MSALICGSLAFDNIMVFRGRFRDHILADQIHILNVAFLVPELRREFGGCAGNVAYNLRLLGGSPLIMATVGTDFGRYRDWLVAEGHDLRHVTEVPGTLTAQAYITTDLDDNQITAFHPGAMDEAHRNRVPTDGSVTLGMLEHAAQFHAAGIPFVFDPGQGLPMFDGDELRRFLDQATWVAVNDYEGRLLCERTGLTLEEVAKRVQALVVTRGAEGSSVYLPGRRIDIPSVRATAVLDPTGCGDAYRAGLLYGLGRGWGFEETGRLAALLGALKVAHRGTQNHRFTPATLRADYRAAFGHALPG